MKGWGFTSRSTAQGNIGTSLAGVELAQCEFHYLLSKLKQIRPVEIFTFIATLLPEIVFLHTCSHIPMISVLTEFLLSFYYSICISSIRAGSHLPVA